MLGDGAGELRDLDSVGEAVAEVVVGVVGENLGLVFKAAEGAGVDDAGAVALEGPAKGMRRLRMAASESGIGGDGVGRERHGDSVKAGG